MKDLMIRFAYAVIIMLLINCMFIYRIRIEDGYKNTKFLKIILLVVNIIIIIIIALFHRD